MLLKCIRIHKINPFCFVGRLKALPILLILILVLSGLGCGKMWSSITSAQSIQTVTIQTPHKDGTKISYLNVNNPITVSGTCSFPGVNVTISGAVSASAACQSNKTWTVNLTFNSVADGTVTIQATQVFGNSSALPAVRTFIKDTAFCGNPANSGAAPFAGGTGTAVDPYLLCTSVQLGQVGTQSASYFRQRNDIDVSVVIWTSIAGFSGTYDGYGFIVKGLGPQTFINNLSGTVTNMGLLNVAIVMNTGADDVAGIADSVSGTISNSYVTGTITSNAGHVGGIAGQIGNSSGVITNSWSSASVLNSGGCCQAYGGLVGHNYGGTISYSYFTGTVNSGGLFNAGGIVGIHDTDGVKSGVMINCFSTGSVSGPSNGGLAGDLGNASITNSFATGAVGAGNGGLVGTAGGGTITNSFWDIDTSGTNVNPGGGVGLSDVQMQKQSSFVGWDFTTPIWTWWSGFSNYPVLYWQ